MAKLSREKLVQELESLGYKYGNTAYENIDTPIILECSNGHEFIASLKEVRSKKFICPTCDSYDKAEKREAGIEKPAPKMGVRVLGLDNATNKTGYAIFEDGKLLTYGVKTTSKDISTAKMAELRQWFITMVKQWDIDYIGLENVQLQGNPQTLITLSKLLGVLQVTAYEMTHTEPYVVSAASWKSFAKIKGTQRQQQKQGAQDFVKEKFGFVATQDAADAICLTLYTVNQVKLNTMITF